MRIQHTALAFIVLLNLFMISQPKEKQIILSPISSVDQTRIKTDTIKVYGNCEMCKSKIEASLKEEDGITSKEWNMETLMLIVTYNSSKITIRKIGKKIARVGYDNEYARAKNEVYDKLRPCCKYQRPKK